MSGVRCQVLGVKCQVSGVTCHIFLLEKWWSESVECLLSTGPTPSSIYILIGGPDSGVPEMGHQTSGSSIQ